MFFRDEHDLCLNQEWVAAGQAVNNVSRLLKLRFLNGQGDISIEMGLYHKKMRLSQK